MVDFSVEQLQPSASGLHKPFQMHWEHEWKGWRGGGGETIYIKKQKNYAVLLHNLLSGELDMSDVF